MTPPRTAMMRAAAFLFVVASATALSGCLTCEPVLEAQRCHSGVSACDPDPVDVREWTADHAAAWPAVDALLQQLAPSGPDDHGHLDWTAEKEEAFWDYWGFDASHPTKDLYVAVDDAVLRIRVITCG